MNKRADALAVTVIEMEKPEDTRKEKSKKSVYIYVATLFFVVILFILLSYLIQQRNNSELHNLNEKNTTAQQHIENLQTMNLQLQSEKDAYQEEISELEKQIENLENRIGAMTQYWQDEVKSIRENDAAQYNELLVKYNELLEKHEVKGN